MNDTIQLSKIQSHFRNSISLIQAAVMVAVLVVLLFLLTQTGLSYINRDNRMKDSSNALQIKTAVLSYQTDYGDLPMPTGASVTTSDLLIGPSPGSDPGTPPNVTMIALYQGLSGNLNAYSAAVATSTGFNSKAIVYLSVPRSAVNANGVIVQSFKANGINGHSPFPSPNNFIYYSVKEDTNYDNILSSLPDRHYATDGGTPFGLATTDSCAVWGNNDQDYHVVTTRWSTTY